MIEYTGQVGRSEAGYPVHQFLDIERNQTLKFARIHDHNWNILPDDLSTLYSIFVQTTLWTDTISSGPGINSVLEDAFWADAEDDS